MTSGGCEGGPTHEAGLVLQSTRSAAIVGASEHTGRERAGFRDAAEALMLLFHGDRLGPTKAVRPKLARIFESFMLSSDAALPAISKHLVNAVVAFAVGAILAQPQ